ncbi:MAG: FAD-dependent oxidoreductase [bacterium]|nr:FAD-dependent oxidoreductase [bacterium]
MIESSPWEDVFLTYDVVIVGAGIIGLSSAIEIAERNPTLRITVLERGLIPTGASTRNAGFACFGSLGEIHADILGMGQEGALSVVAKRVAGLRKLTDRCAKSEIGYEALGGHELFFEEHDGLARLPEINALLEPLLGKDVFTRRDDLIKTFMFGPRVHALVHIKHEATVHSGLLINALWKIAEQHGIRILTGALVTAIDDRVTAIDDRGQQNHALTISTISGEHTIHAGIAVLATNGNMSQITVSATRQNPEPMQTLAMQTLATPTLTPTAAPTFYPARGQVLLTASIEGLPFKGSFHFNDGYYYFRNLGNRILFGGGRNTDFEGERTRDMSTTEPLQKNLDELLRTVIAPGREIVVEKRWSGTMAFAADKQPCVVQIAPNVILAFGCNGMGVALGSNIATEVASLVGNLQYGQGKT